MPFDSPAHHDSLAIAGFGFSKIRQTAGTTSKVSRVLENKSPMTTVAKGRCTSRPMLLAGAVGEAWRGRYDTPPVSLIRDKH